MISVNSISENDILELKKRTGQFASIEAIKKSSIRILIVNDEILTILILR
jgi:hypothetical protein